VEETDVFIALNSNAKASLFCRLERGNVAILVANCALAQPHTMTQPPTPPSADSTSVNNPPDIGVHRVDKKALVAVFLGVALGALDTSIANTALPAIAADLNASAAASVWIVNAYQLAVVAGLFPLAALGDLFGARRVFLWGIAVFTLASFACVVAPDLLSLSIARGFQGLGAAGVMSVNIALIRQLYPPSRLGRGVGLNAFIVGSSFTLGPSVASLVLSVANWPWLFGLSVPLGLVALAFGWRSLPNTVPQSHTIDPLTAALSAVCFGSLIYGVGSAAQLASASHVVLPLLIAGLSGWWLITRQRGHAVPMLPVDLFSRPLFRLSALTAVGAFATQGVAFVALPFYFEQVLHRDPINTGFLMTAWPAAVALLAPFAGRLSDRIAPALLGGVGLTLLSTGMLSLFLLDTTSSTESIVFRMAWCGLGFGLFQSPNLRAIMSSAPATRASGASAVIAMARLMGQTHGAAAVALCFGLMQVGGASVALLVGMVTAGLAAFSSFRRLRYQSIRTGSSEPV
jgi:DHA2 family multidrug resistance protein-like MFS transporter